MTISKRSFKKLRLLAELKCYISISGKKSNICCHKIEDLKLGQTIKKSFSEPKYEKHKDLQECIDFVFHSQNENISIFVLLKDRICMLEFLQTSQKFQKKKVNYF